jgi:hypothetical protein
MSLEHSPAKAKEQKRAREHLTADDLLALVRRVPIQKRSYTITEWCEMRGYSRVYFYTLKKLDNAPDVIGTGKGQRITDDADARWIKRQEAKAKRRGV